MFNKYEIPPPKKNLRHQFSWKWPVADTVDLSKHPFWAMCVLGHLLFGRFDKLCLSCPVT